MREIVLTNIICEGIERASWPEVWDMYVKSYSRIGLIVDDFDDLLAEYDVWELTVDKEGFARAFCLFKSTPFGLKVGLSGSDGTSEGRAAARASFAEKYQRPGVYGEVSHRPAEIAREADVPVVCANLVPKVLRKDVVPVDTLHYRRDLANVGPVTKVLVGRPLDTPTTRFEAPRCPVQNPPLRVRVTNDDDADIDAHYASVAFDFFADED